MHGILLNIGSEIYYVESEPRDIEPGTFRDACHRTILEMVLIPIRKQFKDKITILWPVESRVMGEEVADFTRAYIFMGKHPTQLPLRVSKAVIMLHFEKDNLCIARLMEDRPCCGNLFTKRYFEIKKLSIANPQVHDEAIAFIIDSLGHYNVEDSSG